MGFRVSLRTGVPGQVLKARLSAKRPLFFHVEEGREGVFALVRKGSRRQAYFYPRSAIEQGVEDKERQGGYVYREGFDNQRTLEDLRQVVALELPRWRPQLGEPERVPLSKLLISQPGVDMWRMLHFAMDHSAAPRDFLDSEQSPPLLALSVPNYGLVLKAGNHRALFALAHDIKRIDLVTVPISSMASNFTFNLGVELAYTKDHFDSIRVPALARSFIRQVENAS